MNKKSLLSMFLTSVFVTSGVTVSASPIDSVTQLNQPVIELLSAKIENAIADLPEDRTKTTIQNATLFVLAKQEEGLDLKMAAISDVIIQARSIGDRQVVDALQSIDIDLNEDIESKSDPIPKTVAAKKSKALVQAPPSTAAKGGSDY
ncbi:MAG: hypothetical protein EX271_08840 [Acidimicrobiales bacterium]|nr:hypothetical protein [Hyphomonadaceae bacterium]RZV41056.1 MAG: hypothetical protein EX271_08840 [Acidimicrobiales bacterium]